MIAGDWALRALHVEDRRLLPVARLDYAARWAGSLYEAGARLILK
jgi:hypothetical protein